MQNIAHNPGQNTDNKFTDIRTELRSNWTYRRNDFVNV